MPLARVGLNLVPREQSEKGRLEFRFSSNCDIDAHKKGNNSEIKVRKIDIFGEEENMVQGKQLIEIHKNLLRIRSGFKSGSRKQI